MNKILQIFVEPVAFYLFFYLTIIRFISLDYWLTLSGSTFEKVLPELIFWILDGVLFLWIAGQKKNIRGVLLTWKRNWILLVFILFAVCSMFWSGYFLVSFYKVFVLIACSALAGYIGMTYSINKIIRILFWFFVITASLSYALALLFPARGTHIGPPHFGAWRGLFGHKNSLGPQMALATIVFLLNIVSSDNRLFIRLSSICLYLLTAGLVFLSKSASGMIIFVILNFGLLMVFAWVRWKDRLHRFHYLGLGLLVTATLILVLSNMNFMFGLLNRNASLTGRLPLWSYLVNTGISKYPLFGSGFGATWASDQFRLATQAAIGWDFAPFTAHNGLVDIFLHLGLVGVILFISIIVLCLYRVTAFALRKQTFISFFPILVMIFVITTNISESFILEFESFVWFLMVYALFSTTPIVTFSPSSSPVMLTEVGAASEKPASNGSVSAVK